MIIKLILSVDYVPMISVLVNSLTINNQIHNIALSFLNRLYRGLRLPTLSSQGQVLCPNHKKAYRYVLNIKHELTYE